MELTGIKSLYYEMRQAEEKRQQFCFTYNDVTVCVLFLIDTNPFLLCFSAIGEPQYFQVELHPGFQLNPVLDVSTLNQLKDMFNIGRVKKGEFSTKEFFDCFNVHIPQHISNTTKVRPSDVLPHIKRDVEEADRIYFWR
ncbi:MAG: DUF6037 family protein [Synergistaceae bacterium]|nr:DUF6037 family protein [Synergistaceae bacterium]